MEILAAITSLIVTVMDIPLGWLLALPRDVAIVLIALGTSLLLTLVRKWTTNQDQLRRSKGDLRRLKQLLREAKLAQARATTERVEAFWRKRRGPFRSILLGLARVIIWATEPVFFRFILAAIFTKHDPEVKRLRNTIGMVQAIRLKAEGKPLLWSLLPIILLAVWAVERLDYFPPRVGHDLTVKAYYPLGSVDKLTHLVAPPGVELRSPAIQLVEVDPHGQQNGLATWVLRPTAPVSTALLIRHLGETASHSLRVGGRVYAPPLGAGTGGRILATETVLRQARFLGIVPGIPAIGFPPWLIAYLLIVIPFVPILRRALRVY